MAAALADPRTWADAFGVGHAVVAHDGDLAAAGRAARSAILDELEARDRVDPERVGVVLVALTATSARYEEVLR